MRLIDADALVEEFSWCMGQSKENEKDRWRDVIERVDAQKTMLYLPGEILQDIEISPNDEIFTSLKDAFKAMKYREGHEWRVMCVGGHKYKLERMSRG